MECSFKNDCTHTPTHLTAMLKETLPKVFYIGVIAIMILLMIFLVSLYQGIFDLGSFHQLIFGCSIIGFFGVGSLLFTLPMVVAKVFHKQDVKAYGDADKTQVLFYDDHMIRENIWTNSAIQVEYDEIRKISDVKELILLFNSQKTCLLIAKDGFTEGEMEDFLKFIKLKCPTAKYVKK